MGVDFPAGFCYNAGKLSILYLSEALLLQYLTNLWNALDFGSLESILLPRGVRVPVPDHARDLPRPGGLCAGRPHRQAGAPAEL